MTISFFTADAARMALVATRATLKAKNSFSGLDDDLDQFIRQLGEELTILVKMELTDPYQISREVSSVVYYVMASVWINHWPRRGFVPMFCSEESARLSHLRHAQYVAVGAVLAAAAIVQEQ